MRYQVPQFIEIEDKVIGPLTIKQFIYLTGGAGLAYISYALLPWYFSWVFIIAFGVFSAALAFYKINNKPFIDMVEASIKFYLGNKLYIWKKEPKKVEAKVEAETEAPQVFVPRLSDSKLKDLSWSLDINEHSNRAVPQSTQQPTIILPTEHVDIKNTFRI